MTPQNKRKFWAKIESFGPMLSGIAFMVIFIILCKYFKLRIPATMKDLLASVLNISAIAIGFLATAKSILFSMEKRRVVKLLKEEGSYSLLISYFMHALFYCFLLAGLSAFALLADYSTLVGFHVKVVLCVWTFILGTTVGACWRVIYFFSRLLKA